jgi:hypothetical protein
MPGTIRLGCVYCDNQDYFDVDALPDDWDDVDEVRSHEEASKPAAPDDMSRSVMDWQTHLGLCPECKKIHG